MYRLLVVDDEKIERGGIRFLVRKMEFPLEVLEAANGRQALELLERERADILLTDIKMPFMDGMELIGQVHSRYPHMKILIFSGYSDFAYAQKAIKFEVKDYILKPVEPSEFRNTMGRILEDLKEDSLQRQMRDASQSFLTDHLLYALVSGGDARGLLDRGLVEPGALKEFRRMLLIEFGEDFFGRRDEGLEKVVGDALGDMLGGGPDEAGEAYHLLNLNPQQSILFLKRSLEGKAAEAGERLYESIRSHFGVSCYIAVSQPLEGPEQMSLRMEELERVMENRFFQTRSHVYLAGEGAPLCAGEMEDDVLFKQMKQDIKMKDIPALRTHFGWVCDKYRDKSEYSQIYVKFIFSNLLKDFYGALPEKSRGALDREVDRLYRCQDFQAAGAVVRENIGLLEEAFRSNPQMPHREIETVKQYIYDHYREELGVEVLARQVYMAPSYLSAVFKKETGQNLSKFIKEYRMEKARDMLENTHVKIVQVSEAVGYPNVSYFCQSFREYFGVSPQKFRNQGEGTEGGDEKDMEMAE